jgi:hypothetical protein
VVGIVFHDAKWKQQTFRVFVANLRSAIGRFSFHTRLFALFSHDAFLNLYYSTSRRNYNKKAIDAIRNKPIWFEDISTYPIIIICVGACIGAGGYIGYKFMSSPDVRVDKNKRGSEIRWWGDDKADLRFKK